jgi:hypothetical protein
VETPLAAGAGGVSEIVVVGARELLRWCWLGVRPGIRSRIGLCPALGSGCATLAFASGATRAGRRDGCLRFDTTRFSGRSC